MLKIEPGTKLQLAISNETGGEVNFDMISSFREVLDGSTFLIAAPLKDGVAFAVDENTKIFL